MDNDYLVRKQKLNSAFGACITDGFDKTPCVYADFGSIGGNHDKPEVYASNPHATPETSAEVRRAVRLHMAMKKAATNGDPLAAILTTPIEPRKEN